MKCSICLCTYNGQEYIDCQIQSILSQIQPNDELIVIDDCSNDNTAMLVQQFNDSRIKLIINENNIGPVKSFEKAIQLSKNDFIFLSDQDDVWIDGRYLLMTNALSNSEALLLTSNSSFINNNSEPIIFNIEGVSELDSYKYFKNIINIFKGKTNYYGCCMVFKKDLIELILPIPKLVESHDLWIAMCANLAKKNIHFEAPTLQRRIHGKNASVISRNLIEKILARIYFSFQILVIFKRLLKYEK